MIAVASTFTAEPIGAVLEFWFRQLNTSESIEFARFDQVFQQLLDPLSLLGRNASGVNVVLLRLEDWRPQIERNMMDFVLAITQATKRSSTPFVICVCPASTSAAEGPDSTTIEEMQTRLLSELANLTCVYLITALELRALYPVSEYYDALSDRLARIPYTSKFFSALGTMIARKIHVLNRAPYKVIVLDCDQTLWTGVCGEDGPNGVRILPENEALQTFMIRQHEAGMLLCLCSKNNEDDVLAVFGRQPNMLLTRDHIVDWQINWRPKSENLKTLAKKLNLGLDAFIFIDDDPVECAEVRANCPQVLTLQVPRGSSATSAFLKHVWPFDQVSTTKEGKSRTALYQQNSRREELQKESLTFQEFLAGLDLKVNISPLLPQDFRRASELTYRTNQFNLAGRRRSEAEIRNACDTKEMKCLSVHAHDRFGDYGLVGLLLLECGAHAVRTDTFLLSCRALGKGIEYQMVARLGEIAQKRSLNLVELRFVPTLKNSPAREFLHELGNSNEQLPEGESLFTIKAEMAARAKYCPETAGSMDTASPAQAPAQTKDGREPGSSPDGNAIAFSRIAEELNNIEQIHEAIVGNARVSTATKQTFVGPETPMEQKVAAIWSDILGIETVGIHDSFFDLGGHSLLAMQVLARIGNAFNVELPPSILYLSEFTVAGLSRAILSEQIRHTGLRDLDAILNELSCLSDDQVKALLDASKGEEEGA